MNQTKALSKVGLIVLTAVSLFVCPLATGAHLGAPDAAAQAQAAQISFEPQLTPLVTEAPPGAILAPLVWSAGTAFDCPAGHPERCRPSLLATVGDDYSGYGELPGYPNLRVIWVTDENVTHYLVVDSKDGEFASVLPDDFTDFIAQRNAAIAARRAAASAGQTTLIVGGPALGAMWALCPETYGATCVGAGIGIAVAAITNIIIHSQAEHSAEQDLDIAESNLAGKFDQFILSARNP
jgi:hypothetical protein